MSLCSSSSPSAGSTLHDWTNKQTDGQSKKTNKQTKTTEKPNKEMIVVMLICWQQLRDQERRKQQREAEERELEEKKMAARRKVTQPNH